MKKAIRILTLAVLAVASCVISVSAAGENRNTTVSTEIAPAYVVTIPTNLKVPFDSVYTDFGEVKLETARLEPNKCVKVTLISDNLLDNKADTTKTIPYTINEGKANNVGTAFTSAKYLSAGEKTDLTIGIAQEDWNKAYAGIYEDIVTFQIEYTEK